MRESEASIRTLCGLLGVFVLIMLAVLGGLAYGQGPPDTNFRQVFFGSVGVIVGWGIILYWSLASLYFAAALRKYLSDQNVRWIGIALILPPLSIVTVQIVLTSITANVQVSSQYVFLLLMGWYIYSRSRAFVRPTAAVSAN